MELPLEVDDSETIVRGVCSPFHVSSKGKIKPEAFEPTPNSDEVSVMRHDYMGSDACKARAVGLADPAKKKIYKGLAALAVDNVRRQGVGVVDSRVHFEGHADIRLGFRVTPGEPLPADDLKKLRALTKALANAVTYHEDPDAAAPRWTGRAIELARE